MLMNLLLPVVITMPSQAQMLMKDSARKVMLNDGISVVLYSAIDEPSGYYYLPRNLQVSQRNGLPEISLMLYQNKQKEITGGILHVLLTWGLTPSQQMELQNTVFENIDSLGVVRDAGDLELDSDQLTFDPADEYAIKLETASRVKIRIPSHPSSKTAASFELSPELAQLIYTELFKKTNHSLVVMRATYTYAVVTPGKRIAIAEKEADEMSANLSQWIKTIREYKLYKIVLL
jgi:hypothetical protein